MEKTFKALRVSEEEGVFVKNIVERNISDLPAGELLINVKYSSLNFKDALSCAGNKGVTRNFPHTPGIDAVGIVVSSQSENFTPGDEVIVTSYDLGMNTDGGFSQYISVPQEWAVVLPKNMSMRQAMVMGTAGLTAALCVNKLLMAGQKPENGSVVVTGALGGVGSIAVGILSKLGFDVIAASSSVEPKSDMLISLGAKSRIDKDITDDKSGRPMLKPLWAGAIDVVGGNTLVSLLKACAPEGNVACCGNIGSGDLNMTVYPYILRGINLLGVDSQNCSMELRTKMWDNLSSNWYPEAIEDFVIETDLEGLSLYIDTMLNKKSRSRVIVKI